MRSDAKKAFYFNAEASTLGGSIDQPFQRTIPTQASASLPVAGGHVTTRTEGFNFEEIISCRAAYTRVSGRQIQINGPWSTLMTSVVEGLNILDVVTAERVVAQLSVEYATDRRYPQVSLAGAQFEGLKIGGFDAYPKMNSSLLMPSCAGDSSQGRLTFPDFQKTGREQAGKLLDNVQGSDNRDGYQWIVERYGWMASERETGDDGFVLCSLVDSVEQEIPGYSFRHVVEIPDFGRIFLGEMLVSPQSVWVSMVRTDLGCLVSGAVSVGSGGVGGHTVPP